ncbi:MAG: exopolysaccharide biosynthesis polyprenyl glycosylphosphotransferase, partial [Chloroflexota bacterium]
MSGLLFLSDVAALQLSLWMGSLTRESLSWWLGNALKKGQYEALALGVLVLPIVYAFVGLYPGYGLSMVERLRRRVYTVSVLFALLILWDYLVMRDNPSRGVLLLTFAFAVVLGPLMEAGVRRLLMLCRCWGTPVVVLGAGPVAALLIRILHKEPELGLVPVAVFDDEAARWGTKIEGAPVLGPLSTAKTLGKRVSIALLAMPELAGPRQAHLCA